MPEFEFVYYRSVKYVSRFDARDLDEAKALLSEVLDPNELPDVKANKVKENIDIDVSSVVEVGFDDEEI
jgi:hypothetical protein